MENFLKNTSCVCVKNKIHAQMIQSINVLSMSARDIENYIISKSIENPLIEIDDSFFYEKSRISKSKVRCEIDLYNLASIEQTQSKIANILEQISEIFNKQEDLNIAKFLIDSMDHNGFLQKDNHELSRTLGVSESKISKIRASIQAHCHPKQLLLKDLKTLITETAFQVFGKSSLEYKIASILSKQQSLKQLATKLGKTYKNPDAILSGFKNLSKHINLPSFSEISESPMNINPDLFISFEKQKDGSNSMQIKFNNTSYPSIKIHKEYLDILDKGHSKQSNMYKDALSFIKHIKSRKTTLMLVACKICSIQKNYISGKSSSIKPISMREIAKCINLHPSSISRCIMNKYIQCPLGVMPLKSLFSYSFKCIEGSKVCTKQIDFFIKNIISKEDKKNPKSDAEIKEDLDNLGLHCSRRTITKRRKLLNIPNSRSRYSLH